MIPEKYIKVADAEYFCNVTEFVRLGEGKDCSKVELCRLKMRYPSVNDWFASLPAAGKVRIMRYLRKEIKI